MQEVEKKDSLPKNDREYISSLLELALAVRAGRTTWRSVAQFAAENGEAVAEDTIRKGFKYVYPLFDAGMITLLDDIAGDTEESQGDDQSEKTQTAMEKMADVPPNQTINADGTRTYDRLVVLYEGQDELSEEEMLAFFNLKPDDWVITSCKLQAWHGAVKGGGKQLLYNLRINVRPKMTKDIGLSDIKAFFDRNKDGIKTEDIPELDKEQRADNNEVIKQIDLADPHFGLLAWKPETGEHYDLHIAAEYTLNCFRQFVDRNRGQRIDKIVLVTMGDIIHVDNGNLETTHGTRQDTEGRVPKMLDIAVSTLVACVRMLRELHVPIHYVYVPGNHDQNLGYAVARLVQTTMMGDKNVTFDIEPTYYKCLEYGQTSVIVTHGEAPNKRLPNELLTRHRDAYGRTGASEVHAGHLHSEAVQYVGPVLVRRVPAICESSYWEHSKGYPAIGRGMQVFTYWSNIAGCVGTESYYTHSQA